MRKITKYQKDFNCLPYSFFIREHQYERKTKCYETEVIDMTRRGNYVYIRPNVTTTNDTYFLPDTKGWTPYTSGTFKAIVPIFVSNFEKDYYKYLDIKVEVQIQFANSKTNPTNIQRTSITYYKSAYVGDGEFADNPDEENEKLFCGYDHDKLDSLEVKNPSVVDFFESLSNSSSSKSITLVTLKSSLLKQLKSDLTSIKLDYFRIRVVTIELIQRRGFFEIGDDDPWKEYLSTKFGNGNSINLARPTFDVDDNIPGKLPRFNDKYFYPLLVKNEIIRQDVNIKTKNANYIFDRYCGYYTTDKSVLPVGRLRFTTKDTIYRKSKRTFGIVDLTEEIKSWPILISDDTNPDDVISKSMLQSFSCNFNEKGLPYLKIEDGDSNEIIKISSTATKDLIGNSEDKSCAKEFQFEEYFFDTKNLRNNKVIKVLCIGKVIDNEYIRLGVYTEVVKNTTIYEMYQKVAKS